MVYFRKFLIINLMIFFLWNDVLKIKIGNNVGLLMSLQININFQGQDRFGMK